MTSIRRQLLVSLLGALVVAGLSAALGVYLQAWHTADDLFDYQLRQIALSLRDHVSTSIAFTVNSKDTAEREVVVQIWDGAGLHLYHAPPGAPLPPQTQPGWATVTTSHGTWHLFSLQDGGRVIQVAQSRQVRRALATAAAIRTLLPWLLILPVFGGVIWWLVSRGLQPLTAVARAVSVRTPQDLAPLAATGLPQEVQPLVTALNALLQRLDTAMAAQQAFLADAAHALRTPLTAVSLQAQVVARSRQEMERHQALVTLQQGVQRASHLVHQLLTLAREVPDSGQRPLAAVDLLALLHAVIAAHAPLAAEHEIDLGLVHADPAELLGDAESLRLLFDNLIDNALRYTPQGGVVDVAMRSAAQHVEVTITDTGPGIPPAERLRVFERFYRHSAIPGSGLGLAIAKTIAERHHALITLEDRLGGSGLVVRVTFPASQRFRAAPALSAHIWES